MTVIKLWKPTTLALLAGTIIFSADAMDLGKGSRTTVSRQSSQPKVERSEFEKILGNLSSVQNEQALNAIVDEAMHHLHGMEDMLHDPLEHYRNKEHTAYTERAYDKGFDYTRLYRYQEGHNQHNPKNSYQALNQHRNSDLHQKIQPMEDMLKDIHSLMSLLEQCREVGSRYLKDKTNLNKHTQFTNSISQLIEKHHHYSQNPKFVELVMNSMEDFDAAGREMFATTVCPDSLIVGKKVTTLFPHFSEAGWKKSLASVDMRTGRSKKPITQIRLQGKLWDVFAGKQGETVQSTGHWDHAQWAFVVDNQMEFLPRINAKSKICEYKFTMPAKDQWGNPAGAWGHIPGHPHGGHGLIPNETSYSIVFIPAKNQHPDPRDKSYDAVQDQLAQEIEGEGFKVPDVTNPEESRNAVHEEMRQRLGRRGFEKNRLYRLHRFDDPARLHRLHQLGLPNERIYLSPGDIKNQTYGRVHVPDHRYGRVHERLYAIEPAQVATRPQVEGAQKELHGLEAAQTFQEDITSDEMNHYRAGRAQGQEGTGKESKNISSNYDNRANHGIAKPGQYSQHYQQQGLAEEKAKQEGKEHLVPSNKQFNQAMNEKDEMSGKEKDRSGS